MPDFNNDFGDPSPRIHLRNVNLAIAAIGVVAGSMLAPAAQAEEWQNSVTTYLLVPWLDVGIDGNSGFSTDSSADPGDILDALEFGFMAAGEFRYGKTSLLFDAIYSKLGSGGTLSGPFGASIDVDTKMLLASAALGYDVVRDDSQMAQVFGGLRYVALDTSVSATGGGPIGVGVNVDVDEDYFEPLIGLRGSSRINDRMSVGGFANVGGFGIGSEVTWDIYGGLAYEFTDTTVGNLGFRYISIDYEANNGDVDLDMYGPVLGVTWKF